MAADDVPTSRSVSRPVPRFEPIETERLLLRPVRESDVDGLWERRNDPATSAYQAWAVPYSRDDAATLIASILAHDGVPPGDGWFQITVDDRSTGETLGDLALHLTFAGRCAELGYTFAPAARGRGVATEATAALAEWCFDSVGVSRVSAQMHPDNLASIRVAERVGMVFEGHTRNSFWLDHHDGTVENSDDWWYAMTREDWVAWRDRPNATPDEIRLVEIGHENVRTVLRLATHRSQERFVATTATSLADAFAPEPHEGHPIVAWARAIEADGELVGFLMVAEPNAAAPEAYLWRLLVDRLHQRRGIGRRAVELVIDEIRSWSVPAIETSWVPGPGSPEPLYLSLGFEPTGAVEDGEVVGRLTL
ncbi:MAG: GNAT family N-acetyltransferase [Actinomycetota bacterium]